MFSDRPQHDNPNAGIVVEHLEHKPQLIALRHLDDIEWRPIENDVGTFSLTINFDAETIECFKS